MGSSCRTKQSGYAAPLTMVNDRNAVAPWGIDCSVG
jgi:hypothetical protein